MAKTSMVNREVKRAKLAKQHGAKRAALKKIISSPTASYEERWKPWSSCRSCRATPRKAASATVAR